MEEKVFKQLDISPTLDANEPDTRLRMSGNFAGGISRSTVMREIRRKRLACYRARRTLRFSEETHYEVFGKRRANGKMKLLFHFYLSISGMDKNKFKNGNQASRQPPRIFGPKKGCFSDMHSNKGVLMSPALLWKTTSLAPTLTIFGNSELSALRRRLPLKLNPQPLPP
jgi:hypothetical protein